MTINDIPDNASELALLARAAMDRVNAARKTVATAESCTGGLIEEALDDVAAGFVPAGAQASDAAETT